MVTDSELVKAFDRCKELGALPQVRAARAGVNNVMREYFVRCLGPPGVQWRRALRACPPRGRRGGMREALVANVWDGGGLEALQSSDETIKCALSLIEPHNSLPPNAYPPQTHIQIDTCV
jgi:hypothetical protein